MKIESYSICLVFFLALNGCQKSDTTEENANQTMEPRKNGEVKQLGTASWYGSDFHGKETASGETYNQYAMTAASKTLPLGSTAKVTDVETGKSVTVKINDRGPYVGNRVLDLSKAAASKIGMKEKGVTKVKIVARKPTKKIKHKHRRK